MHLYEGGHDLCKCLGFFRSFRGLTLVYQFVCFILRKNAYCMLDSCTVLPPACRYYCFFNYFNVEVVFPELLCYKYELGFFISVLVSLGISLFI